MQRQILQARLLRKQLLSESAHCYHLEFEVDGVDHFDFEPGQFISTLAADEKGKQQTRAYSIASAPRGKQFDLCENRVEGGFFSNRLADMEPGDVVDFHGPHGMFTLRTPLTDSIFVATGTGIAPMLGFAQWLFPEGGPDRSEGKNIWLVYGTRHEPDLYYREYFERLAARYSNFHYLSTLSRGHEAWEGLRGYVQEHLPPILEARRQAEEADESATELAHMVEEVALLDEAESLVTQSAAGVTVPTFDIHTYICGLNEMVSAVREKLKEHGWDRKQIVFERYD